MRHSTVLVQKQHSCGIEMNPFFNPLNILFTHTGSNSNPSKRNNIADNMHFSSFIYYIDIDDFQALEPQQLFTQRSVVPETRVVQ